MTEIIGICGKLGSGKDTAATFIRMYGYKHMSFAYHMKVFVQNVWRFSDEQIWGDSKHRSEIKEDPSCARENYWEEKCSFLDTIFPGLDPVSVEALEYSDLLDAWFDEIKSTINRPSARDLLQSLGSWGRNIDENLWVKATINEAKNYDKVVISDVRFKNEARAIIKAGGSVIRIYRDTDSFSTHESEKLDIHPSLFSLVIDNDGTLLELHQKIDLFLRTKPKQLNLQQVLEAAERAKEEVDTWPEWKRKLSSLILDGKSR